MGVLLPGLFTILSTIIFLSLERIFPGRELPNSKGWYIRCLLINFCQLSITLATNKIWIHLLGSYSLLHMSAIHMPVIEGFCTWLTGTFFFYWWHSARHLDGLWQIFHQLHHSPQRIEALTSFYKHPVEILADAFLAATGEYFYHSNLKTPKWLKYFIQTPELHSVHHELDVNQYNYSDIPLSDKLFGTYKDADEFSPKCGFPNNNERKIIKMLLFKDVYHDK